MIRRKLHRRVISDINVVPFIDVMLVLLVIFMITAPLINQGVKIELPEAEAEILPPSEREPLILTVDRDGAYYLNLADNPQQAMASDDVVVRAAAVLQLMPGLPVLVKADKNVAYGTVVRAMALLQQAGAKQVGLSTEMPET